MPAMSTPTTGPGAFVCPVAPTRTTEIQLAHGGGGRLTQDLIDRVFVPAFRNPELDARHDGAVFTPPPGARLAFATDSHVVSPLFFQGGDIGALAVHGTANDLAMCGARPHWLSAAFVMEEGLPVETLARVVSSMAAAARELGIVIATGDTKVVERGKGDGLYICTSGIGLITHSQDIRPSSVRPGDAVLLSGDIGRHGMAILAQREGLSFETPIGSDSAHLWPAVSRLLEAGIPLHCLRDLTRGGLATSVIEIAEAAGLAAVLRESSIPVSEPVRGACEILGLDPCYVANEGRFIAIVPPEASGQALALLREFSPEAAEIGVFASSPQGQVTLRSLVGVDRILDRLSGEQLPRIC